MKKKGNRYQKLLHAKSIFITSSFINSYWYAINLSSNYSCIQLSVNDTTLHSTLSNNIFNYLCVLNIHLQCIHTYALFLKRRSVLTTSSLIYVHHTTFLTALYSTLSQFVSLPPYNYSKSLINFSFSRLLIFVTPFYYSAQHPHHNTSNINIEI